MPTRGASVQLVSGSVLPPSTSAGTEPRNASGSAPHDVAEAPGGVLAIGVHIVADGGEW
jgi:hypothetical protein